MSGETDFIVIGAGVAGLRAAVELASAGRVMVLAKREITESNTQYAQGGIAAALSDEDEIGLHLQDTLSAGAGLCDPDAARVLVEEGPPRIEELIEWGTAFDRDGTRLAFTREGAHSRDRILHAHGDSTGREILRALYAKAKTLTNISVVEFEFSTNLIVENGRVCGIHHLTDRGVEESMFASAVLLATGGMGQLYRNTTNPAVATADGVAMAYRAGAAVSDMEFIQFHPTALFLKGAPRFLLSEALRGEGAYLRNSAGERFMTRVHELAELAPRDVVARAIVHELEASSEPEPMVYLDLTHLDAQHLHRRFPRIYSTCLQYGLDFTTQLIPVRPAAHYAMGGVRTDLLGKTNLPGLYSAGEAAATGVHGANRLASNSLLEGLVFGARAGSAMRDELRNDPRHRPRNSTKAGNVPDDNAVETLVGQIQDTMWKNVGVLRDASGLRHTISELETLGPRLAHPLSRRAHEAANLQAAGLLVARSALARQESRGAHYRRDYPERDDERFLKHSVLQGDTVQFLWHDGTESWTGAGRSK